MIIIFNVVLVAIAALIAYWWANQGFFSALLHLVCVIAAGAIALGTWEFVTVNYLLRGGWFDEYAWGMTLLGTFAISLFLLRLACDRLVPENLNLPTWVNYSFGTLFGAGAGVITVGICLIGIGFLQSSVEIVGFRGVVRDSQNNGLPTAVNRLYPPLHTWTATFYSHLSGGALSPMLGSQSLARSYPALDDMALALWRDGASEGQSKASLAPGAARVDKVLVAPEASLGRGTRGGVGVQMTFDREAYHLGERMILSASQVRLIGRNPSGEVVSIHPTSWVQTGAAGPVEYAFDDVTHFASSIAGQQTASFLFIFPSSSLGGTQPEFIQVKGVRFALPAVPRPTTPVEWMAAKIQVGGIDGPAFVYDPNAMPLEDTDIRIDATIAPLVLSKNQVSGMEITEDFFASGRAIFAKDGGFNPSRALRIKGLLEPPGTKIVKLNVSRGTSSVDIWGDKTDFRQKAGSGATVLLIDDKGNQFAPYGFFWERQNEVEIMLDPVRGVRSLADLPNLPAAGTHKLSLLYQIPEGTHVTGVKLGRSDRSGAADGIVINNASVRVGTAPVDAGPRFGELGN